MELVDPLLRKSLFPEKNMENDYSGIASASAYQRAFGGGVDHAILPSTSARFAIAAECCAIDFGGRAGLKQGEGGFGTSPLFSRLVDNKKECCLYASSCVDRGGSGGSF